MTDCDEVIFLFYLYNAWTHFVIHSCTPEVCVHGHLLNRKGWNLACNLHLIIKLSRVLLQLVRAVNVLFSMRFLVGIIVLPGWEASVDNTEAFQEAKLTRITQTERNATQIIKIGVCVCAPMRACVRVCVSHKILCTLAWTVLKFAQSVKKSSQLYTLLSSTLL